MEREFDAYKLSRWMCPCNYNRFSDRARYWSKIVIFSYPPPCIRRPRYGNFRRNITTPFGVEKLEWCGCGYPMVKKFRRYLYSFWRNSRTWQTDRHRMPTYTALMHMHRAVKILSTLNHENAAEMSIVSPDTSRDDDATDWWLQQQSSGLAFSIRPPWFD